MDESTMKCKNTVSGSYYSKPLMIAGLSVTNFVLVVLGGFAALFVLGLMWRALTKPSTPLKTSNVFTPPLIPGNVGGSGYGSGYGPGANLNASLVYGGRQ